MFRRQAALPVRAAVARISRVSRGRSDMRRYAFSRFAGRPNHILAWPGLCLGRAPAAMALALACLATSAFGQNAIPQQGSPVAQAPAAAPVPPSGASPRDLAELIRALLPGVDQKQLSADVEER